VIALVLLLLTAGAVIAVVKLLLAAIGFALLVVGLGMVFSSMTPAL
jgi:hypothetical protein